MQEYLEGMVRKRGKVLRGNLAKTKTVGSLSGQTETIETVTPSNIVVLGLVFCQL